MKESEKEDLANGINSMNGRIDEKITTTKKENEDDNDDDDDDDDDDDEDEYNVGREDHIVPLIDGPKSSQSISIAKIKIFKPRRRSRILLRKCFYYLFLLISTIILISLIYKSWNIKPSKNKFFNNCDKLTSSPIWNQTFSMITINSAVQLFDVNNDSFHDVILPFKTGNCLPNKPFNINFIPSQSLIHHITTRILVELTLIHHKLQMVNQMIKIIILLILLLTIKDVVAVSWLWMV